ncbi:MAG: putative oxidoreductase [Actinomycetota bacterium]|nr:putative oxidoreductase [Actinomycetota bacterium]
MDRVDTALLAIRLVVGLTLVMHGWNHLFGGGRIPGAARWFESLGLRPGVVHAWMSTFTEVAAGVGIAAGFLTPVACGAAVGLMVVAGVVAHRPNGFFIFREGYEYVLMIAVVAVAIAIAGPGSASIDSAADIELTGTTGGVLAAAMGLGGALLLLVTSWRPSRVAAPATEAADVPAAI